MTTFHVRGAARARVRRAIRALLDGDENGFDLVASAPKSFAPPLRPVVLRAAGAWTSIADPGADASERHLTGWGSRMSRSLDRSVLAVSFVWEDGERHVVARRFKGGRALARVRLPDDARLHADGSFRIDARIVRPWLTAVERAAGAIAITRPAAADTGDAALDAMLVAFDEDDPKPTSFDAVYARLGIANGHVNPWCPLEDLEDEPLVFRPRPTTKT